MFESTIMIAATNVTSENTTAATANHTNHGRSDYVTSGNIWTNVTQTTASSFMSFKPSPSTNPILNKSDNYHSSTTPVWTVDNRDHQNDAGISTPSGEMLSTYTQKIYPYYYESYDDYLSQWFTEYKKLYNGGMAVYVYIIPALCVFGIICNIVSIGVLCRKGSMERTTKYLMIMLAIGDITFLASNFPQSAVWAISMYRNYIWEWYTYLDVYSTPVISAAQTATVWLVVLVSADRYISVCFPLHLLRYNMMFFARIGVGIVWLFAVLFNIPRFFEYHVNEIRMNWYGLSTSVFYITQSTKMNDSPYYWIVYMTILWFIFRFALPFSLITFFNERLIKATRKARRAVEIESDPHYIRECDDEEKAKKRSSKQRQIAHEARITITLVTVVVVFVITELPAVFANAVGVAYHYSYSRYFFYSWSLNIANFLLVFNSSVNFFIYVLVDARFRSKLKRKASENIDSDDFDAVSTSAEANSDSISAQSVRMSDVIGCEED